MKDVKETKTDHDRVWFFVVVVTKFTTIIYEVSCTVTVRGQNQDFGNLEFTNVIYFVDFELYLDTVQEGMLRGCCTCTVMLTTRVIVSEISVVLTALVYFNKRTCWKLSLSYRGQHGAISCAHCHSPSQEPVTLSLSSASTRHTAHKPHIKIDISILQMGIVVKPSLLKCL